MEQRRSSWWRRVLPVFLLICFVAPLTAACERVEPGHVGIKVNLSGGDRGVQRETLDPGLYWLWFNQRIFTFPTFVQNYVWAKERTEQSPTDEAIDFASREGANINSDFGIQYAFQRDRIPAIFERYRLGATEITRQTLRNEVRDALVTQASTRRIEDLMGEGKAAFMDEVLKQVRDRMTPHGIIVDNIYAVGQFRVDSRVTDAITRRLAEQQETQRRAQSVLTAQQEAERLRIEAEGQAAANRIIAQSITPELVQYFAVQKWNGTLPAATSGVPFIALPGVTSAAADPPRR
jgi:regulator of protease activity HflC (stomatin/prohibitin superfamily)